MIKRALARLEIKLPTNGLLLHTLIHTLTHTHKPTHIRGFGTE